MRTTLDVENDVVDAARALAVARGVSVGAALSELARRGVVARTPLSARSGFPVFQVPREHRVSVRMRSRRRPAGREDLDAAKELLEPGR